MFSHSTVQPWKSNKSVTDLGLKSLKPAIVVGFHFLYWEVSGANIDA